RQMKVTKAKTLNTSRLVTAAWLQDATCHHCAGSPHGTPVQRTPPLGSLRIATKDDAQRAGTGNVCAANDRIALRAPWGASRSAGVWGRVRSTLRQLTSRGCLRDRKSVV